jgi:hypothetical protein
LKELQMSILKDASCVDPYQAQLDDLLAQKPPRSNRGRPLGRKDSKPRKRRDKKPVFPEPFNWKGIRFQRPGERWPRYDARLKDDKAGRFLRDAV